MLTQKELNDICEAIEGTCRDLETVVEELTSRDFDDLTVGELQEIDNCVVYCETCSWWVDAGEVDEDGNCEDCQEEDD